MMTIAIRSSSRGNPTENGAGVLAFGDGTAGEVVGASGIS
jgi:hypothetical protein